MVPSDDESDREYHLPAGIQHLVAKPSVEEEPETEEGEKPEEEVDEEELSELTKEAKIFIGPKHLSLVINLILYLIFPSFLNSERLVCEAITCRTKCKRLSFYLLYP